MKKLTNAEKRFCELYADTADPLFSAREAKLKNPEKAALTLIFKDEIIDQTVRVLKKRRELMMCLCENAVMKIICSPVCDTLRKTAGVSFSRDAEELRGVSELKETDKGAEVKFFDKIKAYEKLSQQISVETENPESGLFGALSQGARAIAQSYREAEDFEV